VSCLPGRPGGGKLGRKMNELDPIYEAGRASCRTCGAIEYATEAAWFGLPWLLARFTPTCEHGAETFRLVNPDRLTSDPQCCATTKAGRRCRLAAATDGWCELHAGMHLSPNR
jgi:hypothetical protein